jgi:hypothetical protein
MAGESKKDAEKIYRRGTLQVIFTREMSVAGTPRMREYIIVACKMQNLKMITGQRAIRGMSICAA